MSEPDIVDTDCFLTSGKYVSMMHLREYVFAAPAEMTLTIGAVLANGDVSAGAEYTEQLYLGADETYNYLNWAEGFTDGLDRDDCRRFWLIGNQEVMQLRNPEGLSLTVPITLSDDPVEDMQVATKQYVDAQIAALKAQLQGGKK